MRLLIYYYVFILHMTWIFFRHFLGMSDFPCYLRVLFLAPGQNSIYKRGCVRVHMIASRTRRPNKGSPQSRQSAGVWNPASNILQITTGQRERPQLFCSFLNSAVFCSTSCVLLSCILFFSALVYPSPANLYSSRSQIPRFPQNFSEVVRPWSQSLKP